jgi:hypothetical protein
VLLMSVHFNRVVSWCCSPHAQDPSEGQQLMVPGYCRRCFLTGLAPSLHSPGASCYNYLGGGKAFIGLSLTHTPLGSLNLTAQQLSHGRKLPSEHGRTGRCQIQFACNITM